MTYTCEASVNSCVIACEEDVVTTASTTVASLVASCTDQTTGPVSSSS